MCDHLAPTAAVGQREMKQHEQRPAVEQSLEWLVMIETANHLADVERPGRCVQAVEGEDGNYQQQVGAVGLRDGDQQEQQLVVEYSLEWLVVSEEKQPFVGLMESRLPAGDIERQLAVVTMTVRQLVALVVADTQLGVIQKQPAVGATVVTRRVVVANAADQTVLVFF